MRNTLIILLVAALSWSCGATKEGPSEVMTHYLAVKDALVATDATKASKAAKAFLDINENKDLNAALDMIANNQNVEIQRRAFEQLSMSMYNFVKTSGSEVTIYKQYCPMAFKNKGAYWLSTEEQVVNPYFGDVMLHCGSVQETITQ